jgi:hypothetical protein
LLRSPFASLFIFEFFLVDFFFDVAFGDELMEELLRSEPEIHQHRVDCAKSHAKVLLVKSDRNVLVNPITHISDHEFLKSDRFELDLLFNVFQRILQRELFGTSVVEQI